MQSDKTELSLKQKMVETTEESQHTSQLTNTSPQSTSTAISVMLPQAEEKFEKLPTTEILEHTWHQQISEHIFILYLLSTKKMYLLLVIMTS